MNDRTDATTDDGAGRRTLLRALAGAGTASLAGCSGLFGGEESPDTGGDGDGGSGGGSDDGPTTADETTTVPEDRARALAERFAPVLYFDARERWFPTDPRPYASERDGERVVDGFDALDGYTRRFEAAGEPPDPTVFYQAVEYDDSPLTVVQFWIYSAFDQFSVNFHWHDWEVVHVFLDTAGEEPRPQLYVASAHSRKIPNNEFLDPEPSSVPRVLAELGSHSSALSLNERDESFQRLASEDVGADITNRALTGIEAIAELPFAYGLPRDEGSRLPYVVPELDGAPIDEHPDLPNVSAESLVPPEVTIRSGDALSTPPASLPRRETGTVFDLAGRETPRTDPDVSYELVPTAAVEDISAFAGRQLSFEFAVPGFAEDAVASHLTTTETPWSQPRYADPAVDITEPSHRAALAERYDVVRDPGPINSVVAAVTRAVGAEDAPENEGLTTTESPVETVALLESDPETVPTFAGVATVRDVPAGEHRLTVNGAGYAPHSETVAVAGDGSPTAAGVEGRVTLVDSGQAVKLSVDADGTDADLTDLAVEDDFAGRLYDAPMDGPDAVYVDRRGAYTTEVRDADGALGAFRVNPDPAEPTAAVTIDSPRTGKASLASFVADIGAETRAAIAAAVGDVVDDTVDGVADGTETAVNGTVDGTTDVLNGTADTLGSAETPTEGGTETPTGNETATPTDERLDGDTAEVGEAIKGLVRVLDALVANVERAVARAEAGNGRGADRALEAARDNLERAVGRFAGSRDALPDPVAAAVERRFGQAQLRASQALEETKL